MHNNLIDDVFGVLAYYGSGIAVYTIGLFALFN